MSGLTADARTLIDHGRVESQQHRFTYNEPMPLESLTQVLRSACGVGRRGGGGRRALPQLQRRPCCKRALAQDGDASQFLQILPFLAQSLCDLALRFGEDEEGEAGMSRPFGVALLVAGWDAEGGPVL